jgi:hypothetical protein
MSCPIWGRAPGRLLLTVVLDDLSEVVGHEVPQGALVGEAQAMREQHRSVHHGAVDDLWAKWATLRLQGAQGKGSLPIQSLELREPSIAKSSLRHMG